MSGRKSGQWLDVPGTAVGDAVVAAMTAGGVDYLFFTSGSEIAFYQEAIAKAQAEGRKAPKLITVPHEHASLNAALGYAAVTGRPAATAAHVDVGTQHYGGAVHTAWHSSLPVLITAGYPPTAYAGSMPGARDEGGHLWVQENYDQGGIVRHYTKWDHRLEYQDNPGLIVSRALQVARSEPSGPVYLTFPRELTLLPLRDLRFPAADQLGIARPPAISAETAREVAERLIAARQPVVVVSGSGRNPATVPALVSLCERLSLAVVDSARRAYLSFPMRHPLLQDTSALKEADVVLVLDVDVPWLPGANSPPDDAHIIALGFDPIRRRIPTYEFTADLRLTADPLQAIQAIDAAAQALLSATDKARLQERASRCAEASCKRLAEAERDALAKSDKSPIDPLWVSYQIGQVLDDNCIVLDDTMPGNRLPLYLRCTRPGSYFSNPGSSGGWSPGAAFGAKLGAPERDVVAVTGDGFYMFGTPAAALWAAAHHGAPFLTIVYTNRSYSTGTLRLAGLFRDSYAAKAGFPGGYFDPPIDFAKEAEAAGAYGENVRDPAEVGPALKRGLEHVRNGKPAVISVWLPRLLAED
jgi:acetolactate synthase-1/2/3 large subunit